MKSAERIDIALLDVACRMHETQRPDHILDDPFAAVLLTDHGKALYEADADPATSFMRAVSFETVDEVLQQAVRHHRIHTVADLGAGLNTRPYRLELPSDLRWIEVDIEPMLGYKALRLAHAAPHCQVRRLGVNLFDSAAREGALGDIAMDVTRGLVLTGGLPSMWPLDVLKDLVEHMPRVFNYWIADTVQIRPRPNLPPSVENTGERSSRTAMRSDVILEVFERGHWRPIQFLPVNDQANRLDPVRATGSGIPRIDADHQGVWLFQRGG